jgi:hypothetical protein
MQVGYIGVPLLKRQYAHFVFVYSHVSGTGKRIVAGILWKNRWVVSSYSRVYVPTIGSEAEINSFQLQPIFTVFVKGHVAEHFPINFLDVFVFLPQLSFQPIVMPLIP